MAFIYGVDVGIVGGNSQCANFLESGLPSGVNAVVEEQFSVLVGASQGVVGNLVGAGGEIFLADGLNFLYRDIDGFRAGLVESDEFASHKIVGHLIFNGVDSGYGVVGVVAVWAFIHGGGSGVVFGFHFLVKSLAGIDDIIK